LVRTKKLQKLKMQMSPESGNDRSLSPESGEHVWPNPAKIAGFRQDTSGPGQIRLDPVILAGSRQDQWPDPVRSGRIPAGSVVGSGHIRPDSGHFGQIRPDQCPDPVRSGRFLSMTGFRPDSAGIRRSCRMSPDSGCRRFFGGLIPAAGSIPGVGFRRRHYCSDLMMPDSSATYF
jgi:hypothetical protein